jgi:hypothetical protein
MPATREAIPARALNDIPFAVLPRLPAARLVRGKAAMCNSLQLN